MDKYGLIRVAACSPEVHPADINFNLEQIIKLADRCVSENVDIVVFPELCITGYTCADLFGQTLLIRKSADALLNLAEKYSETEITIVVGLPIAAYNRLFNCAAVLSKGKICGLVPKTHVPNYGEYYEKRWFASGLNMGGEITLLTSDGETSTPIPFGTDLLFNINGVTTGIEICEDLWVPTPPSSSLAEQGATLILNLSATNELIGKHRYLCDLISNQSARCRCGYVYASAGAGESSTDLAFAGNCIIAGNGTILAKSERFTFANKLEIADIDIQKLLHDRQHYDTFSNPQNAASARLITLNTDNDYSYAPVGKYLKIKKHPFLDSDPLKLAERCEEISSIQAWGLAVRLKAINCRKAVVGISGGLDSTLALLVTVKAFDMLGYDRKGITGITMPGFGTTNRTKSNASELMDILGISQREIPIADAVKQHFKDIAHDIDIHDVTYENSQARMRTMILMDVANQENGIVVGTGDLSELALGWCTYNGDQMSMYGVNASIPKTLVKYLVNGYAKNSDDPHLTRILQDIIETPISPELLPPNPDNTIEQKTEDLVGPYELHDFFLYHIMRFGAEPQKVKFLAGLAFKDEYDEETIGHWLAVFYKRFFNQQFKRSAMPDGVKAGSVCLSPRGDWRMPSDASSAMFIADLRKQ